MGEHASRRNITELVGGLDEAIRLLTVDNDHDGALKVALDVEDELVQHLNCSGKEDALSRELPSDEKLPVA